jgi:RecA-family ATPase
MLARVLINGLSGTGKSTVLLELARRGHQVLDTDYGDWVLPDGTWDEPRVWAFLNSEDSSSCPARSRLAAYAV